MQRILKKLKIVSGDQVLVMNLPAELQALFQSLPYDTSPQDSIRYTAILAFVPSQEGLTEVTSTALQALESEGKLWMAYPKKTSGIQTTLTRDQGWDPLVAAGYGTVAAISIDATWSALRFKPEAAVVRTGQYRTNQPLKSIPAADRILQLPDYLDEFLNQHPAEKVFFESLAYTHRKEYINWISDAKRMATREERLLKMLGMLKTGQKSR